jgi:CBS domain-containing protein
VRVNAVLKHKGHEVVTVRPETTVQVAVDLFQRHRVGALVVSADGRRVDGLLAERDVVSGLAKAGAAFLERAVAEVMSDDPPCCDPDDTLEHLMAVMTRRRVRHVPVVVDGELRGIVSIGDVVERRLYELESEKQVLHDYITLGR